MKILDRIVENTIQMQEIGQIFWTRRYQTRTNQIDDSDSQNTWLRFKKEESCGHLN